MKTVYVQCRDHHDPVWNKAFEEQGVRPSGAVTRSYSEREALQFDRWLELLAEHSELRYEIEQTCTIRQYLRTHPDLLPVVRALVAEGRIEFLAGGESVIDTNLVHGETIYRNLLYGLRWLQDNLGARPRVPGCPDTFGLSAQLPQILRQFGFTWLGIYSRVFGAETKGIETERFAGQPPRAFWRGVDGSLLCIVCNFRDRGAIGGSGQRIYHYGECPVCLGEGCRLCGYAGMDSFVTQDVASALPALDRLRDEPFDALRLAFATEETVKHPDLIGQLRAAAAERGLALRFITSGDIPGLWLKDRLARLERGEVAADEIDARPEGNPVATGCYVTRSTLKRRLREAEHLLLAAETLSVIAARHGRPYPRKDFAELWRLVCLAAFHDGVTGSHVDAVYPEVRRMDRMARTGAGQRLLAAARHIAARVAVPETPGAAPVVVFNPLLHRVRGVRAEVAIEHGVFDPGRTRRVADWTMRTPEGNPVAVIEWSRVTRDDVRLYRIHFLCPALPPCGYTTILAVPAYVGESRGGGETVAGASADADAVSRPAAAPGVAIGRKDTDGLSPVLDGALENERYRVEWNARGISAIHDRRVGRTVAGPGTLDLWAEDDVGSFWETLARFDLRRNLHDVARIETRAFAGPDGGGPVRKLEIHGRLEQPLCWELPKDWRRELRMASDRKLRDMTSDEAEVCIRSLEWRLELWVLDGWDTLPMRLTVRCDSENVRLSLPFDLGFTTSADRAWYGIPGGAIERPSYRPGEAVHCGPDGHWPAVHWAAAVHPEAGYSAGLLDRGIPAHRFKDGVWWLSVLRSPRIMVWGSRPVEVNRASEILAKDAAEQVYEFAWLSGPGGIAENRFAHRGAEFNTVFTAVPTGEEEVRAVRRRPGFGGIELPAEKSFLAHESPGVLVEAVKLAEDNEAIVIRAREAYGAAARDAIAGPLAGAAADEISPMEDRILRGPSPLDYRPYEIKTLRLWPTETRA